MTPLVFTNTREVKAFCKSVNITALRIPSSNPYGMPYLVPLLRTARKRYPDKFYIYTNSDILLNPSVVSLIPYLQANIPTPVVSDSN